MPGHMHGFKDHIYHNVQNDKLQRGLHSRWNFKIQRSNTILIWLACDKRNVLYVYYRHSLKTWVLSSVQHRCESACGALTHAHTVYIYK